jgi:hypothetical protein
MIIGQSIELKPVILYDNYIFHGMINNNIEIGMSLNIKSENKYDNKGCIIGYGYNIIGSYEYVKYYKPITLIGTVDNLSDTIVLFEMDENFNKTAFFKGILKVNEFSGIWTNLKKPQKYSFLINQEKQLYGHVQLRSNNCNVVLNHIDNADGQGVYKVITSYLKENKIYALLESSEPCCGAYNCRGSGCGGENTYLRLYIINEQCSIIECKEEVISSTCNWIEQTDRRDDKDFLELKVTKGENGKPIDYNIKVDKKNLDKGITKKKIEK